VASERFDIPVVTIVVQGGPNTVITARDSVKAGCPVVVIDKTGQAADLLAYAWNFLHSEA
jgi:transient receptor potential cation channel subfamily M protein 2